ncbi:MAG TPA: apolipoprotein N-acyltransferase [Blastocatellia bacterium]|nr:apolipoprotein N-acyltransferase [Blastocatellia bacterium]
MAVPRLKLPFKFDFSTPGSRSFLRQSAQAVATAVLLILAFPTFNLNFLAWVALAPLLLVIAEGVAPRRAFWLGWLVGVLFTFAAENWIAHSMTYFGGMLTVVAYSVAFFFASILAFFPALFAAAMARLVRSFGWWALAFAPAVWVATEYLRPIVTGVTWNALGVSQVEHFPIARLARYGGAYLISAEIVAVSTLLVLSLRLKERRVASAAGVLLLASGLAFLLPETDQLQPGAEITAVVVQPNLPPDSIETSEGLAINLEQNIKLTREALDRAPDKQADLVIWAESPLVLFYENDPALRQRLDRLARETGSYFIINTIAREGENFTNSVQTISPAETAPGTLRRYDKIRLVPFGEYVPWRAVLGYFVPTIVGDFAAGREAVVNTLKLQTRRTAILSETEVNLTPALERTTNFIRVGAFICYEAAYPDLVKQFVRNGATLLVNVSNDAWFGDTAGPHQHLRHAMLRAIENDRDLLRVTNTGISAMITAEGRVADQLPSFTQGSQVWRAHARRTQTFYVRHGDWVALACSALAFLVLLSTLKSPLAARLRRQKA